MGWNICCELVFDGVVCGEVVVEGTLVGGAVGVLGFQGGNFGNGIICGGK